MKELVLRTKPRKNEKYLFLCDTLQLKDLSAIRKSEGVLFNKIGNTSHVAVIAKIQGIPLYQMKHMKKCKDGDKVLLENNTLKCGDVTLLNKNNKIDANILKKFDEVQVSVFDYKNVKMVNDSNAKNIKQFFVRDEFIWINEGIHPSDYYEKKGSEKTIGVIERYLLKILNQINKYQCINFRSFDLRSNETIILNKKSSNENNPDMGLHGIRDTLRERRELLLSEIKAVDNLYTKGYKNIIFSIPFITTKNELLEVKHLISENCKNNIKLGVFIENPSAVSEMSEYIDIGVKNYYVGMKDLVQFLMAADRGNSEVEHLYDVRSKVVKETIEKILSQTNTYNIKIFIFSAPEDISYFLTFKGARAISVYAGCI